MSHERQKQCLETRKRFFATSKSIQQKKGREMRKDSGFGTVLMAALMGFGALQVQAASAATLYSNLLNLKSAAGHLNETTNLGVADYGTITVAGLFELLGGDITSVTIACVPNVSGCAEGDFLPVPVTVLDPSSIELFGVGLAMIIVGAYLRRNAALGIAPGVLAGHDISPQTCSVVAYPPTSSCSSRDIGWPISSLLHPSKSTGGN